MSKEIIEAKIRYLFDTWVQSVIKATKHHSG